MTKRTPADEGNAAARRNKALSASLSRDFLGRMPDGTQTTPLFSAEDLISSYSRDDAIADGTLVSADTGDLDEVTRQHFGGARVAMTPPVFALIEKAVAHPRWLNDWRGVWHDICGMSRLKNREGLFLVIITGTGRRRNHVLKRVDCPDMDGTPTVTFMLRDED